MSIYLTYYENKTGGEVRAGHEDESWPDYEDEVTEWYLMGATKTKPSGRSYETVDMDLPIGSALYVVYVRYTTGGTFGRTLGYWHIAGCFGNSEDAMLLKDQIYAESNIAKGRPWVGYFESFESCGIEVLRVTS